MKSYRDCFSNRFWSFLFNALSQLRRRINLSFSSNRQFLDETFHANGWFLSSQASPFADLDLVQSVEITNDTQLTRWPTRSVLIFNCTTFFLLPVQAHPSSAWIKFFNAICLCFRTLNFSTPRVIAGCICARCTNFNDLRLVERLPARLQWVVSMSLWTFRCLLFGISHN